MDDKMKGTVIRSTGSWYEVMLEDGSIKACRLRGKFKIHGIKSTNPVVVGDHVVVTGEEDNWVIAEIGSRNNYIVRKATNLSKRSHIIASNIDQAILICTLKQPRTSLGFIDRFLVTAEAYHIPVLLVFNKYDLYDDAELELLKTYFTLYKKLGYPCLATSVKSGYHIEELIEMTHNKVNLFTGHSGVGKSSIINSMDSALSIKTGDISEYHFKGKHTTTFAEMHSLTYGGFIVDTPGIKEFGLIDFEKKEIGQYFPEIREMMHECKYTNCVHEQEPHCAIKNAVSDGNMAESRYLNYINMLHNHQLTDTSL